MLNAKANKPKLMLIIIYGLLLAKAASASNSQLVVLNTPSSLIFEGNFVCRSTDIRQIISVGVGNWPMPLSPWIGMKVADPFRLPNLVLLIYIEGTTYADFYAPEDLNSYPIRDSRAGQIISEMIHAFKENEQFVCDIDFNHLEQTKNNYRKCFPEIHRNYTAGLYGGTIRQDWKFNVPSLKELQHFLPAAEDLAAAWKQSPFIVLRVSLANYPAKTFFKAEEMLFYNLYMLHNVVMESFEEDALMLLVTSAIAKKQNFRAKRQPSTTDPTNSTIDPTDSTIDPTASTIDPTASTIDPNTSTMLPSSDITTTGNVTSPTTSTGNSTGSPTTPAPNITTTTHKPISDMFGEDEKDLEHVEDYRFGKLINAAQYYTNAFPVHFNIMLWTCLIWFIIMIACFSAFIFGDYTDTQAETLWQVMLLKKRETYE